MGRLSSIRVVHAATATSSTTWLEDLSTRRGGTLADEFSLDFGAMSHGNPNDLANSLMSAAPTAVPVGSSRDALARSLFVTGSNNPRAVGEIDTAHPMATG